jgi:signal transduction histidine kinase
VNFFEGALVTMGLAAVAAAVALVPAVVSRVWTRTIPWPMLLLASLPLVVGAFSPSFVGDTIFALGIAALAILVVVALQMTTTVRMTPNFAIAFVVLTTLATAGFWALGSAASAQLFGTRFIETNDQLMAIFTSALVASGISALAFRWYFGRVLEANRGADAVEEVDAA